MLDSLFCIFRKKLLKINSDGFLMYRRYVSHKIFSIILFRSGSFSKTGLAKKTKPGRSLSYH